MPYSLNDLSPEEKIAKYQQLNSTPDPSTYSHFTGTPVQPTAPAKAAPTIDFSANFGNQLPPVIAPKAKDIAPVPDSTPAKTTQPSVVGFKAPDVPLSAYSTVAPFKEYTPSNNTSLSYDSFEDRIRNKESNNNPSAMNPHSSATGYYQFLWNDWHDSIKNVTGITDRDTFRKSPEAQKQFFKYYFDNHILPNVQKIKSMEGPKDTLSDFDLAQLIHFRGAKSARELIESGQLNTKQESYNPTAMQYITGK